MSGTVLSMEGCRIAQNRQNPCLRKGQPTPVFLPGEFPAQRSLAGYSPCGHKESDTTELAHLSLLYIHRVCAQTCLTLCNFMDCSLPGFSVHGIFPGKNNGVRSYCPTQESNLGLLHCRWIFYHLYP